MMIKNVVDNFPVLVEINPTYKLLLVSSCLLDEKNFYAVRNLPWLDKDNWGERNHWCVLALKKKKDGGAKKQNPLFVSCWNILNAVDLIFVERR